MKVLIADDHPIFREGLRQILQGSDDSVIVEEANDGHEVLEKVIKNKYDVIILDISMPGRNGLEILEQLKAEHPDVHVLMLSMFSEQQYAVKAIKAGASGYLTKNGAGRELNNAIHKILSGSMYISPAVAEQLVSEIKNETEKQPHELLSPREFQVMLMIGAGNTNSEIAKNLSISSSAVSTHRARILKKMHLKNSAEIIRYTVRNDLVD